MTSETTTTNTKANTRELTRSFYSIILDESGSMYAHKADTIGSLKQFFADQHKISSPDSHIQLVTFNHTSKLHWTGQLNFANFDFEYSPLGNTALYDAIYSGIQHADTALGLLDTLDKKPADIYCIIITDGEENASRTHTQAGIRELIKEKTEKYNWKFVFLGANQDAFKAGGGIGINTESCLNFAQNSMATPCAMRSVSQAIYRTKVEGPLSNMRFTDGERYASNSCGHTE